MADNLTEFCSVVGYEVDLVNSELGYLAEEISKQSDEVQPCFSLLLIVKCKRKEIRLRKMKTVQDSAQYV